jgi:putative restriction endonuclease
VHGRDTLPRMPMQELMSEIKRQPAWEANGDRAPHKPLAILFAIGRALAGSRMTRYVDAEAKLKNLLDEFGPTRDVQHPEQPIWRLRQYQGEPTSFWQLEGPLDQAAGPRGNPRRSVMCESVSFGLSEQAAKLLCDNPSNALALAMILVADIAPFSRHDELLEAVGISSSIGRDADAPASTSQVPEVQLTERAMRLTRTLVRNPAFSRMIRDAYNGSCAICGVAPKLCDKLFGLEAAHVRWANAGGPDEIYNGVLLCTMHHHALDRGAIKIDADMKVQLSPKLARSPESDRLFTDFEGERIRLPARTEHHPHQEVLAWHWKQVFRT